MNKNKELAINTVIIMFGKMCTQFLSFLLLPLYTSLLSTEEYGTFDLVITIVSLCMPFIFWQIEDAIFRFLVEARNDEEKKISIVSTVFKFVIKHIIVVSIIYMCIYKFLNPSYRVFLYLNFVCTYLATFSLQIVRGLGKNIVYSMGSFLSASISVVCNVLFIAVLHMRAEGMLLALCVGNVTCFVYVMYATKIHRYLNWKMTDANMLREMLKYSLPMIPNLLAWTVIATSDRLILTAFLGAGATGIFSVAHKFPSIFSTVYGIFNLSWTESVTLHLKDADGTIFVTKTINSMYSLFSAVAIGIVACMPFVFPVLVNSNYQEAYNQIPILILGTMFNVIVGLLSVIYIALKQTSQIAKSSVFAAIINVVVNLILVKQIGIYAASLSTVIAYAILALYRYVDIQKYVKILFERKRIIISIIVGVGVCIAYYSNDFKLHLLGVFVAGVYGVVSNRKILLSVCRTVKNKIFKLTSRER